jgi:hypothetical protein
MKKTSEKTTSKEGIIRKLSRLPWTIHVIPVLGILILMFWLDHTSPWNLVSRLLALLYIYGLSLVELSRSSRQPSRAKRLKQQIVMAIVVLVQIAIPVWKWFLIPAADFHDLYVFLNIVSATSVVFLISELFYAWP